MQFKEIQRWCPALSLPILLVLCVVAVLPAQARPVQNFVLKNLSSDTHQEVTLKLQAQDATGRTLPGLKSSQVQVYEAEQEVQGFKLQAPPPQHEFISVALVLDSSHGMAAHLANAKQRAKDYLQQLYPTDRVALFEVRNREIRHEALSQDLQKTKQKIDQIHASTDIQPQKALNDTLMAALNHIGESGSPPAHRIVLLFSDGEDLSSTVNFNQVLARAQGLNIAIHTIGYNKIENLKTLKRMSSVTGGKDIVGPPSSQVMQALYEITAKQLNGDYTLTFASLFPTESKERELQVALTHEQNTVQQSVHFKLLHPYQNKLLWIALGVGLFVVILIIAIMIINNSRKTTVNTHFSNTPQPSPGPIIDDDEKTSITKFSDQKNFDSGITSGPVFPPPQDSLLTPTPVAPIARAGGDLGHLVVKSGHNVGQVFTFARILTRIGKKENCDIRLQDQTLSREHANIQWEHHHFVLHDMGSANGTWVNGRQIQAQPLRDGDTLEMGDTHFIFKWTKIKR